MAKLIGTDPNQVPTNADLGTMAYQDYDAVAPQFLAGRRNLIINGDMRVAQRGTSQTNSSYGSVDRWYIYSSGGTFTQETSSPPEGFSHYLTCTSATGSVIVSQAIELPATGSAGVFYNGQTITISYYAKSTSAGDALYNPISFRNGVTSITNLVSVENDSSDTNVLTTSWARYSKTYTIGVNLNSNNTCLVIQPRTSGAPSGDISITGVQLELGKVATPFEHRSYGEELALCQRYYHKYGSTLDGSTYQMLANGFLPTTSRIFSTFAFSPPMRTQPTMFTTGTPANYAVMNANANTAVTAGPSIDGQTSEQTVFLFADTGATMTAGQGAILRGNGTSAAFLGFDAEL